MIRHAIFLSAALTMAGCSGAPVANEQAATAPEAKPSYTGANLAGGSWEGVWGDAARSIDHFGRIGLRPGAYQQTAGGWRSEATPTALADPSGPAPVMAYFVASGDAKTLDKVAFTLVEPAMSNDQQARDQFEQWMKRALTELGVTGGDTAAKAIHGEKRLTGKLKGGADYAVTRETNAKERRLAVTFTRAAPISGEAQPKNG